jgi:tetratricopeptide (TPR) repeat protein
MLRTLRHYVWVLASLVLVGGCSTGTDTPEGRKPSPEETRRARAGELIDRGMKLSKEEKLDQAIECYSEAIRQDPRYGLAYIQRAQAWEKKGQLDRALADYDKAVRVTPSDAFAHRVRGLYWLDREKYDQALTDFDQSIRLDPHHGFSYLSRGMALYHKGKYEPALADLDKAIRLNPDLTKSYAYRGMIRQEQGQYKLALADFNQYLRLHPKDAIAYAWRGGVALQTGDLDRALADYNQSIRLNAKEAILYENRSIVWWKKGCYARALVDLQTSLRLDPGNYMARSKLAMLRATCPDKKYRNGDEARMEAGKACLATDWKYPYALECMAAAHAELGRFEEAAVWQRGAIRLIPEQERASRTDLTDTLKLYKACKPLRIGSDEDRLKHKGGMAPEPPKPVIRSGVPREPTTHK